MPMFGPKNKAQLKSFAEVSTLGLEIALCILAGAFGGRWLDGEFGTEPWLQWVGLALGIAAAGSAVARVLRAVKRDLSKKTEEPE